MSNKSKAYLQGMIVAVSLLAVACLGYKFLSFDLIHAGESQRTISPFALKKWHVDENQVQSGDYLVVSVDNDCLQSMSEEDPSAAPMAMQFLSEAKDGLHGLSVQSYRMQVTNAGELDSIQDLMETDACVQGIDRDMTLYATQFNNDPRFENQGYLKTINAEKAHDLFWASSAAIDLAQGEEVVIAVVDTGIDGAHEDLSDILWNDGNGNFGFDFVNNDSNPTDDQGHGTHVAGLAAAHSSNTVGISGVMGFQARLMGVKVLNANGAGGIAAIANGIRFAADNGADIINLSLGGTGANATLADAVSYAVGKGSTVFIAAGNDGVQITTGNFYSPAGYAEAIDGAITIGSIDSANKSRSNFSNFSSRYVELAAPGSGPSGILSTYRNNAYASLQGTSMATPIVAGAGALVVGFLRSRGIVVTPAKVEEILKAAAARNTELVDVFKDGNVLDLAKVALYLERSELMQATGGLDEDF